MNTFNYFAFFPNYITLQLHWFLKSIWFFQLLLKSNWLHCNYILIYKNLIIDENTFFFLLVTKCFIYSVQLDNSNLTVHLIYIQLEFVLIIISVSKVLSPILQRSGRNVFPATLKSLSTGAELAGIHRYFSAILAKTGNLDSLIFQ